MAIMFPASCTLCKKAAELKQDISRKFVSGLLQTIHFLALHLKKFSYSYSLKTQAIIKTRHFPNANTMPLWNWLNYCSRSLGVNDQRAHVLRRLSERYV